MADHEHDAVPPQVVDAGQAVVLGYAPMDGIHEEFQQLMSQAAEEPATVCTVDFLERVDAHLREHFEAEDRWMTETEFPPRDCHMDEHAAVLRSSSEVLQMARAGDFTPAPGFVAELGRWFPGHADYLDSALAAWMCKRRYGGKPIVLRRSAGPASPPPR